MHKQKSVKALKYKAKIMKRNRKTSKSYKKANLYNGYIFEYGRQEN